MKLNLLTYISILCIVWMIQPFMNPCYAQGYEGQLCVTPYELRQQGDTLYMDMDIDISRVDLEREISLILTPVLTNDQYAVEFQDIIVNGKNRHKVYNRQVALRERQKHNKMEPLVVVSTAEVTRNPIRYQIALRFEEWMTHARLDLKQELTGCCGYSEFIAVDNIFSEVTLQAKEPYAMSLMAAYIKPPVEEIKSRSEQQEAFLDFPVAKTEILPNFRNNPFELAKIEDMIRIIREDKNTTVTRVTIVGYASPEGQLAANNRFSAERAQALRNYLSMRAGFPSSIYYVDHGGEDWNGLLKLVEESYITYKDEIISIIRYTPNPDERKRRLKRLGGGIPYRQMLNEMYPKLRRVVSKVEFTVRGFNELEAREVMKVAPQQLSLEEMFMAANTYPVASEPFVEVFETAVRMYPDDEIANLNAAASALSTGDIDRAERYLAKANKTTPEYKNNIALLYMMRGEYDHARTLLSEAAAQRVEAARHNLDELEKREASEATNRRSGRR